MRLDPKVTTVGILAAILLTLSISFLFTPPNRRFCDDVCNLSQCGCVETCPKTRGGNGN